MTGLRNGWREAHSVAADLPSVPRRADVDFCLNLVAMPRVALKKRTHGDEGPIRGGPLDVAGLTDYHEPWDINFDDVGFVH